LSRVLSYTTSMLLIENKKARFEYEVQTTYQAGVVLSGAEVKSLRNKSGSLAGSFVKVIGDEVFLLNAQISPYTFADNRGYEPKRTRKLLFHKKEILKLMESQNQKGNVLIPLAFTLEGNTIKVTVAVGRGKKQFEKRAQLKQRDIERDIRREVKEKVRLR
jgi:SsrA-binding protein